MQSPTVVMHCTTFPLLVLFSSLTFLPLCFYVQDHPHISHLSLCFQEVSGSHLPRGNYFDHPGGGARRERGICVCRCTHRSNVVLYMCVFKKNPFKCQLWVCSILLSGLSEKQSLSLFTLQFPFPRQLLFQYTSVFSFKLKLHSCIATF